MARGGLGQVSGGTSLTAWRRELALAREAGIPVPILKAIKATESGGNPASIRFEPHLFWKRRKGLPSGASGAQIRAAMTAADMAAVPYTPCTASWRAANGLSPCGHDRAASEVGSETNRSAFNRAYAVDASNAIKSTSWGSGQVLGWALLDAYDGSPSRAVAGFFANPVDAGERMIAAWWHNARPAARTAANATPPDFETIAHNYNGCTDCTRYADMLRTHYARELPAWEAVRAAVEAAGPLSLSSTTGRVAIVGASIAALALGGGFVWWAYKGGQMRPNRRRRRN